MEFGVVEFDNTGQNLLGEREIFGPQFSDIQKLDKLNFGGEHTIDHRQVAQLLKQHEIDSFSYLKVSVVTVLWFITTYSLFAFF